MRYKSIHTFSLLLLLTLLTISCTEPYALQTNTFEEALVIEATITNELKNQEIKISKTYRFEENGPTFETGATVSVTDDLGNEYPFQEINGSYFSINAFQAVSDKKYTLSIVTANGKKYKSTPKSLTTINQIESVLPIVSTNIQGQRGVQIVVNNYDPTNSSKYYRYEYEETSKVTAPKWKPVKAILVPPDNVIDAIHIQLVPRTTEARICYTPNKSNSIILTNTNDLSEDRVVNFEVNFLKQNDYTIAERYSILVKQYVESLESYTFYKTLQELSQSENVLSPIQPGFLYGNLFSTENPNEKIIGYFNVSSVSEKRMFFNYSDLFPGEAYPNYFDECTEFEFNYCFDPPPASCDSGRLNGFVSSNSLEYFSYIEPFYYFVKPICGNCTSFSSNIRPAFWVD